MIKNDDLGLLLGTMDPEMLTDGTPVDPAVLDDWNSFFKQVPSNDHEFIEVIDSFLDHYEKNEGFDFPYARKVLKQSETLDYVKTAKKKLLRPVKNITIDQDKMIRPHMHQHCHMRSFWGFNITKIRDDALVIPYLFML
ncbi:MAG: hypothetical protein K6F71_04135 [Ruminococcus sp.]|uniref:hypothetical protein n=1 Tax=Ruminococcus sp. TaxID=41978 RepID=UPI0025D8AE79|nr:hypothetical protein [Ruminococcus sp.]MCR5540009.1 hypothetical protein [Ruminococcus sp.]